MPKPWRLTGWADSCTGTVIPLRYSKSVHVAADLGQNRARTGPDALQTQIHSRCSAGPVYSLRVCVHTAFFSLAEKFRDFQLEVLGAAAPKKIERSERNMMGAALFLYWTTNTRNKRKKDAGAPNKMRYGHLASQCISLPAHHLQQQEI